MDIWKSRGGKSLRREEKKREDQRRERVRRKNVQVREKVEKSRNTAFFQWFVAPEGQKVGSLKRRARSHLARREMKNCTPLWREAHLEVKKCRENTSCSDHFWKLRCRKSARRCGTKHISKSKCTKHTILGPLLEVDMSKKCTPLWREAHFHVKSAKNWWVRRTFGRSDAVSHGRRKGLCTLPKVIKTWGIYNISKSDGRRGTCEEDLQRCIFRGRCSTRDMFIRDVRRSGRWFPTSYLNVRRALRCEVEWTMRLFIQNIYPLIFHCLVFQLHLHQEICFAPWNGNESWSEETASSLHNSVGLGAWWFGLIVCHLFFAWHGLLII